MQNRTGTKPQRLSTRVANLPLSGVNSSDVSYQVIARKYRPRTFEEVVGQPHVIKALTNAIELNRLGHAFLFVGPRGIGKTSMARLLAKALNAPGGPSIHFDPDDPLMVEIAEGHSLDVLEIDGASNNGVDQVRELRENAQYRPTHGQFKIYIIDEVHMLSMGAFNALLKTLEEPPPHVKFIFATTEGHKVPATILSRCQRYEFRRLSDADIAGHLATIARKEGIQITESALELIARNAEGGMRDAESALDQLIGFCGQRITERDVLEMFGLTGSHEVQALASAILVGDSQATLHQAHRLFQEGKDLSRLTQELLKFFRNGLLFVVSPDLAREELSSSEFQYLASLQPAPSRHLILSLIDELVALEGKLRFALVKEVLFEITMLRMCLQREKLQLDDVLRLLTGKDPLTLANESAQLNVPACHTPSTQTQEPPSTPPAQPEPEFRATLSPSPDQIPSAPPDKPDCLSLWSRVAEDFIKKEPLLKHHIAACHLQHHTTIPKAPDQKLFLKMKATREAYEKLLEPRNLKTLNHCVESHFGPGIQVQIELEEIIVPPEPKPEPPPSRQNSSPSPKPAQDDFLDDPLIREALERFEAKLIKNPTQD